MIFPELLSCLLFSAFFSGLETGLLSADQLVIYSLKERGVLAAKAADFLLKKPERLLGTTLIGTNIAVVTAAVLLSSFLRQRGPYWGVWSGSLVLSLILLIFSEIIPKSFFRQRSETISIKLSPILLFFYFLFLPLTFLLNRIVNLLLFIMGRNKLHSKLPQSREDLRLLVRLSSREAGLDPSDYNLFINIFNFRNTMAREAAIPLHEYPVCRIDCKPAELAEISLRTGYRFIPVYQERTDNLMGYVDTEEMLYQNTHSIRDIMKKAKFYPDTKKLPDLLLEMNRKKIKVVFLSDEYGAVSGLITPKQIASEIVGFIPGKEIVKKEIIHKLSPGHFHVSGTTDLEDLHKETGIPFIRGNYDTIGGFICERMGEIPKIGATFEEGGVLYRVIDRDARRIKKLEIIRKKR